MAQWQWRIGAITALIRVTARLKFDLYQLWHGLARGHVPGSVRVHFCPRELCLGAPLPPAAEIRAERRIPRSCNCTDQGETSDSLSVPPAGAGFLWIVRKISKATPGPFSSHSFQLSVWAQVFMSGRSSHPWLITERLHWKEETHWI